jgi:glyoxylase-like metal-dependent hydrolase (beta-lactamase superfamily II)
MVPAKRQAPEKLLNCRIMTTFTTIDLNWVGRPKSIAALLVESIGVAAVVDPGPESTLGTLRENLAARGLDFQSLDSLLLTHIHLDHAGATGAILRENPRLKVYVHEFGAIHMADPSRLLASAGRLYGGDLKALYGECLPVPEDNLKSLEGGERIRIGETELEVFYTPGHASHHVSYWDQASRIAMVGDTAGIRVEGDSFLLPATPPPDIDVEIWNQSLDAISSWAPERLFLTHFGFIENPQEHVKLYKSRLEEWSALTAKLLESGVESTAAEKAFVDSVTSEIKTTLPRDAAEHYIFNGGLRLSWLGLLRYARKKASPSPSAQSFERL